jgi:hypothetical protein
MLAQRQGHSAHILDLAIVLASRHQCVDRSIEQPPSGLGVDVEVVR